MFMDSSKQKLMSNLSQFITHTKNIFLNVSLEFFHCKISINNFYLDSTCIFKIQRAYKPSHITITSKWFLSEITLFDSINDVATENCILPNKHLCIT